MKPFLLSLITVVFTTTALADLKTAATTAEFNKIISEAEVPVLVQFSAYWCGPCKQLQAVLNKVAPSYNDDQVLLVYVDAYVNKDLKKYLQGGYPTVRTFKDGELTQPAFVGSQTEAYVRKFIDALIEPEEEDDGEEY